MTNRLVLPLMLVAACSAPRRNNSQLRHDLDRPTNEHNAFQWVDVTDEQFITVMLNGLFKDMLGGNVDVLPQDHALTQRSQFWLSRIDESIRARHPKELVNTPKPRAIV